jgi:hypothetical protein
MMELTFFYPPSQQMLFTDREYHLGLLDLARESLKAGSIRHLALLGPRRIGKTLLIKEFIQRTLSAGDETFVPVYLDCQRAPLTPESFAVHYTGTILFWLLRRGQGRAAPFRDLSFQLEVSQMTSGKACFPLKLFFGQAKSVYTIVRQPGKKDNSGHTRQPGCRAGREPSQLKELDSSGHAQCFTSFFRRHLQRQ